MSYINLEEKYFVLNDSDTKYYFKYSTMTTKCCCCEKENVTVVCKSNNDFDTLCSIKAVLRIKLELNFKCNCLICLQCLKDICANPEKFKFKYELGLL